MAPGEIYRDAAEELQLPGSHLAFRLPNGFSGRLAEDASAFKIFSADRKLSCFVFVHSWSSRRPQNWLTADFTLGGETLRPTGEQKHAQSDTVFRHFAGPTIIACKFAKTNRDDAGVHGSAATSAEDAQRLKDFMNAFLASLHRGGPASSLPARTVQPAPPAPPPTAQIIKRDQRLRGLWHYSSSLSSGSASMTTFRFRYFAADGRFAQGGESYATFVTTGSGGEWAGMDTLHARVPPGERGTWETAGGMLTLNYEDNTCSEFDYYIEGNDLLLKQSGRENQLWTRG